METKRCGICKEDLPRSAFNTYKHAKDGLRWGCKECEARRKRNALAQDKIDKKTKKQCTNCKRSLPLTAYRRDKRRSDGRQAMCKACRTEKYGGKSIFGWKVCHWCGEDLGEGESKNAKACGHCRQKSEKWLTGERAKNGQLRPGSSRPKVYLCVSDPSDGAPFKGGHFNDVEMQEMLEFGYWEEDMIFEYWRNGEYKAHYQVAGEQETKQELVKITGMEVQGDKRFLRTVRPEDEA